MVFTYLIANFVVEVFMNSFQFTDYHNDFNKEIGTQLLQVPDILTINFGSVQI